MKISDFGTQIHVCPPKFDETNYTLNINVGIQTAKAVDDAIIAEVYKIAKKDGITHLIVLDRENVKKALMKASAKKVYNVPGYKTIKACPTCNHELIYGSKYCDQCGQKLDWTGEYMD
jgi:hypothetical protein